MSSRPTILLLTVLTFAACGQEPAETAAAAQASMGGASTAPPDDRLELAVSAAPAAISSAATVMDWDPSGALVELRAGTNGWMCLADENPAIEGDAPICVEAQWQELFRAHMARETPNITAMGVSYMLQGGPAASNTDPFATAPAEGDDWIHDGPHLMIVVPDASALDGYPSDPDAGGPYVMWKDTPYAHLMVPVAVEH